MITVAITDPLPLFRQGVAVALYQCQVAVAAPSDLQEWIRTCDAPMVIHTIRRPRDWRVLEELTANAAVRVVVLLSEIDVQHEARAAAMGAQAVLARGCEPTHLTAAVADVLNGRATISSGALRLLRSDHSDAVAQSDHPSWQEIDWLRQLAAGSAVKDLAEAAGYSERMMFRLLHDLYHRLGVKGRMEAILMAERRNWF